MNGGVSQFQQVLERWVRAQRVQKEKGLPGRGRGDSLCRSLDIIREHHEGTQLTSKKPRESVCCSGNSLERSARVGLPRSDRAAGGLGVGQHPALCPAGVRKPGRPNHGPRGSRKGHAPGTRSSLSAMAPPSQARSAAQCQPLLYRGATAAEEARSGPWRQQHLPLSFQAPVCTGPVGSGRCLWGSEPGLHATPATPPLSVHGIPGRA